MARVTVKLTGPLFRSNAAGQLQQVVELSRMDFADEVLDDLRSATGVFKNPTGRYKSLLHAEHAANLSTLLPGNLPYVAWIEGTGSRNATTRFKGYWIFRNVRNAAANRYEMFMWRELRPAIQRLFG